MPIATLKKMSQENDPADQYCLIRFTNSEAKRIQNRSEFLGSDRGNLLLATLAADLLPITGGYRDWLRDRIRSQCRLSREEKRKLEFAWNRTQTRTT